MKPLPFIMRIAALSRRYRRARLLGIPYTRASQFALPSRMDLNGREQRLSLPDEHGVKTAFVELLLDDCYGLSQIASRGGEIARIIDIGANVGLFSLVARESFPEATIHCYEPNPTLEPFLSHQCQITGSTYFLEGVGLNAELISLDVVPEESVHTASRANANGSIPQIAFRTAIERMGGSVDLVKMDCEGAEWSILKDREHCRMTRFLTLEYHLSADDNHGKILEIMSEIGFRVYYHEKAINFGLIHAERIL